MRRRLALAVLALGIPVALAHTATAAPPTSGTGTIVTNSLDFPYFIQKGMTQFNGITATGEIHGLIEGTISTRLDEVLNTVTGNSTLRGTTTCVCTVGSRSGTVVLRQTVKITGDPFFYTDQLESVSATGGLAGIHLKWAATWEPPSDATYTGSYHFDS